MATITRSQRSSHSATPSQCRTPSARAARAAPSKECPQPSLRTFPRLATESTSNRTTKSVGHFHARAPLPKKLRFAMNRVSMTNISAVLSSTRATLESCQWTLSCSFLQIRNNRSDPWKARKMPPTLTWSMPSQTPQLPSLNCWHQPPSPHLILDAQNIRSAHSMELRTLFL